MFVDIAGLLLSIIMRKHSRLVYFYFFVVLFCSVFLGVLWLKPGEVAKGRPFDMLSYMYM